MGKIQLLSALGGILLMIYYAILSLPIISKLDKLFYGISVTPQDVPDKNLLPGDAFKHIHKDLHHDYLLIHNKIRIHYVTIGVLKKDKPMMLFVHGFPECWYSWRHQMVEFAKEYNVVAIDMRGYNLSSRPEKRSDYAMDYLVSDLEAIIKALSNDGTAVVAAHDWGGAVAWSLAHKSPQMVTRLIVMNIPHPKSMMKALQNDEKQIRMSWYMYYFQIPFIAERAFLKDSTAMIATIFKTQFVNKEEITEEDVAVYQEATSRGNGNAIRAMMNYYRNLFTFTSFFSGLKGMNTPLEVKTLLVWGEEDTALGRDAAEGSRRYVKDLTLEYVPKSSHWVQQDTPTKVNEIMREFLKDLQ